MGVQKQVSLNLPVVWCRRAGHSRWTFRLLEEKLRIILDTPVSREAIRRALKTNFDLTAVATGASRQKTMPNS